MHISPNAHFPLGKMRRTHLELITVPRRNESLILLRGKRFDTSRNMRIDAMQNLKEVRCIAECRKLSALCSAELN
jgi:hypothetical protein